MASLSTVGRGKPICAQSKEIVSNLYNYFQKQIELDKSSVLNATKLTSKAIGLSVSGVRSILREKKTNVTFKNKKKPKARKTLSLNDYDKLVLRKLIHSFYSTVKEFPSLLRLCDILKERSNFTSSITTFRTHVIELGFKWRGVKNKNRILLENDDIRIARVTFITDIAKYRLEGRPIVYVDETFINTSHISSASTDFFYRPAESTPGLKAPISKVNGFILVNAGGKDGFVPNAFFMFPTEHTSEDHHDQINYEKYEEWLLDKLIPNLEPNTVVVVDSIPFHNKFSNPVPNCNSLKQELIDWLVTHNIPHAPTMCKTQLYSIILKNKDKYLKFKLDDILNKYGHTCLRVPTFHPDLKPFANIWHLMKLKLDETILTLVEKHNVSMHKESLINLIEEVNYSITVTEWQKYYQQVIDEEENYIQMETTLDEITEGFVNSSDISDCEDDMEIDPDDEIDSD